jgi:hypothetical protein
VPNGMLKYLAGREPSYNFVSHTFVFPVVGETA